MSATAGLRGSLSVAWRIAWRPILGWVFALGLTMVATTSSIRQLYDTQAKIDSYAAAVGSGDALVAINGRVAGLDTLGGVVANEFGFLASFVVPLMGISLMARLTRREEESGRLELVLAGRIGRTSPLLAALLLTAAALAATALALFGGLVAVGVEAAGAIGYVGSLGLLGLVFAGVAAVAAQLVPHARAVYAVGLGTLVGAYLLRGIGDVLGNALVWLSPLGWAEQQHAFGDRRWWPVVIPLGVTAVLVAVAVGLVARRDVGSAPAVRPGAAPAHASTFLRTPIGQAVRLHAGSLLGWGIAAVIVSAAFGSLTRQLVDAMHGNPALVSALGGGGPAATETALSMFVLILTLLLCACAVQAVGVLRAEETSGRLEPALSGRVRRTAWLGGQALVVGVGLLLVAGLGTLALGISASASTGDRALLGRMVGAVAAYLPAVAVLGALALALFGLLPRAQPLAWAAFAGTAFVAYLGQPLHLPAAVLDLAPTTHVGAPLGPGVQASGMAVLALLAGVLAVAAFAGFRRRDVPRG